MCTCIYIWTGLYIRRFSLSHTKFVVHHLLLCLHIHLPPLFVLFALVQNCYFFPPKTFSFFCSVKIRVDLYLHVLLSSGFLSLLLLLCFSIPYCSPWLSPPLPRPPLSQSCCCCFLWHLRNIFTLHWSWSLHPKIWSSKFHLNIAWNLLVSYGDLFLFQLKILPFIITAFAKVAYYNKIFI